MAFFGRWSSVELSFGAPPNHPGNTPRSEGCVHGRAEGQVEAACGKHGSRHSTRQPAPGACSQGHRRNAGARVICDHREQCRKAAFRTVTRVRRGSCGALPPRPLSPAAGRQPLTRVRTRPLQTENARRGACWTGSSGRIGRWCPLYHHRPVEYEGELRRLQPGLVGHRTQVGPMTVFAVSRCRSHAGQVCGGSGSSVRQHVFLPWCSKRTSSVSYQPERQLRELPVPALFCQ